MTGPNSNLDQDEQQRTAAINNNSSTGQFTEDESQRRENAQIRDFGPPQNPIDIIDRNTNELTKSGIMAFPSDRPKYYVQLDISKYSRETLIAIGNLTTHSTIVLPMPTQLTDRHDERWDQVPLDMFMGGAINFGAEAIRDAAAGFNNLGPNATAEQRDQAAKSFANAGGNIAKSVGLAAVGAVAGGAGGAGGAAGAVFRRFGQAIGTGLQAISGIAPNQFMTILYSGPRYKIFNLHWKLGPRNYDEANVLRHMANKINNAAAPELFFGGLLFKFPDIFSISFRPNAGFLYKFKPAVVINCTINRAPGGVPSFYHGTDGDNPPESLELGITFMELEYWLKGDYTALNDPGAVYNGQTKYQGAPAVDPNELAGGGVGVDEKPLPAGVPENRVPGGDIPF